MTISISWLNKPIACSLMILMVSPFCGAAVAPQTSGQQSGTAIADGAIGGASTQSSSEPDSPGAIRATNQASQQATSGPQAQEQQAQQQQRQSQQMPSQQIAPAQQIPPAPTPVGTAAAPYIKPEGSPASRPAGAAIAPAKQRRIRSIALRVGLLVGGAIAIGTVAAASMGSSSRP